jgi:hypothetical protein
MSDISKYTLLIIHCYLLVITVVVSLISEQNGTNNSQQFEKTKNETSIENLTALDYDCFSYDVIDHRTLLVKYDITRTIFFQQGHILYDAYLYVSKLPSVNYKIQIQPFSGSFEKEIDGTIIDHFTFCLVLVPSENQNEFNITLNKNTTKTIDQEFVILPNQQHIIHYCIKLGPNENRHHIKQGSKGDHVLLLLQLLMIGIFLVILQIVHSVRNRKYNQWRRGQVDQVRRDILYQQVHSSMPGETLQLLRFTTINDDESQEENNEQEDSVLLSHRRLPSSSAKHRRSRSPSPSIGPVNMTPDTSSVEHILKSKPWLQIPN